jgi:CDP-6-deoxy-D-xylo-4-hexulose-3-dehydrase
MTMGEGGCVATDDNTLADIVRSLRDWGRDCRCAGGENGICGNRYGQQFRSLPVGYDHKYVYSHIGYNLKLTDMQAAIGCAQLNKIDKFTACRKANFKRLYDILAPYQDRFILPCALEYSDPSWFGFAITVRPDAGFTRNELTRHLEADNIETRNLFAGNLLRHPAYEGIPFRLVGGLGNSDLVTTNTFFIGVYPGIGDAQLEHIKTSVDNFMRRPR